MPSVRTRNPAARRRPPRGAPSRPGTQELSTGKHSATGRDKPRTQQPGARPRGKHKGLVLVRGRALLQGIFLTQGSNLDLLRNKWILYCWATREAHTSAGRQAKLNSPLQRWSRDYNWCSILCRSWPLAAESNLVTLLLSVPLPFCHHESLSGALVTFKPCLEDYIRQHVFNLLLSWRVIHFSIWKMVSRYQNKG